MAQPTILGVPPLSAAAVFLAIVLAIYTYFIRPAFFGPLAKIPNAHWSAPISPLWILNQRRLTRATFEVHKAHQRLGPIVRLAPNEVSVNSVEGGLRAVYAGSYEKGDWYSNIFCNYGVRPMFAMEEHGPHSRRKRMLSNIYAKSTLQSSLTSRAITNILLNDRYIPELKNLAAKAKPVEFYTVFAAITTDSTAGYVFGLKNGTNYIQQSEMGVRFFRDFKARQRFTFWPQELPLCTRLIEMAGLIDWIVPPWVAPANRDLENWLLDMCMGAERIMRNPEGKSQVKPEDWPTVYAQFRDALIKESPSVKNEGLSVEQFVEEQKLTIASELLDHTLAGFDTSSITLTFLAWELSRPTNLRWQDRLYEEAKALHAGWDAKEIDSLPILHAILMETLRLHAAIPGNQPRITPTSASLGPPGHAVTNLPANVRVQAQAWSLHRNADVFPDPETWNPGRWLDSSADELKEMQRWFWAFGSGGRMCVGSNLAMVNMKAIIAATWSNFKTTVAGDEGMIHNGGYIGEPVGKNEQYLLLNLETR